jgi:hypothetical protein
MDKLSTVRSFLGLDFKGKASADDVIDRLNHQYTAGLLVAMALLVSAQEYVGATIACWCPAHFTVSHVDFTNSVCWVALYWLLIDWLVY